MHVDVRRLLVLVEDVVADEVVVIGQCVGDRRAVAAEAVHHRPGPVVEGVDVEQRLAIDGGVGAERPVDRVDPTTIGCEDGGEVFH